MTVSCVCPFHGPECVADPREGQDFDWREDGYTDSPRNECHPPAVPHQFFDGACVWCGLSLHTPTLQEPDR